MVVAGSLVTLLVCGALLLFGRAPERPAALVVLAGLAASLALQTALGFHRQLPVLLADVGLTVGFIVLSQRYRRVWLAAISLILITLLILHASLSESPVVSPTLAFSVNALDLLALAVLTGGAVAERRRRRAESARGGPGRARRRS